MCVLIAMLTFELLLKYEYGLRQKGWIMDSAVLVARKGVSSVC